MICSLSTPSPEVEASGVPVFSIYRDRHYPLASKVHLLPGGPQKRDRVHEITRESWRGPGGRRASRAAVGRYSKTLGRDAPGVYRTTTTDAPPMTRAQGYSTGAGGVVVSE